MATSNSSSLQQNMVLMPGGTCKPVQSADAEQQAQRAQLLTRLLAEMLEHLPKCQHVTPLMPRLLFVHCLNSVQQPERQRKP